MKSRYANMTALLIRSPQYTMMGRHWAGNSIVIFSAMLEQSENKNREDIQAIWAKRLFALSFALFGVTILLHGIGVFQLPEWSQSKQQPVRAGGLRCDTPVWDFGEIDSVKNPRLSHEFVLVNESKETVTIQKVHSSCGCMVAEDYDKELPPGKSTRLHVELQLPTVPQRFGKELAVETGKGILPLGVVGKIAPNSSYLSVPTLINFGTVNPGEAKERSVKIVRYDFSPIHLSRAECDLSGIECELVSVSANETTLVVVFNADTQEQPRNIETAIYLFSADKTEPELRIPVRAMLSVDSEQ